MTPSSDRTVYRPADYHRLLGALGLLMAAAAVPLALSESPWALLLLPAGFMVGGNLWRKAVLTDTDLTVQGRVSRRAVPLTHLQQAGLSTFGAPWVQPQHGPAFELRMVSEHYGKGQGARNFLEDLRARAVRAGATLGPELPVPTDPEGERSPVFSW